ncbi:Protein of uncharacterised function DUF45 [Mycobacteroides abscessus subsp. abscessus]|nr:Protein of uncharacterised function DUF45 [Mycobacteroides abscessus subsp. abscessus]
MPEIVVVRSSRRRKTVSARMDDDGRARLMVPATSSPREVQEYIQKLLPDLLKQRQRNKRQQDARASDEYLIARAEALMERLPKMTRPTSIRWVTNQNTRWGSATPSRGSIRLSHVLQGAPEYVIDFVLHHELCHFIELNHSARFRALESLYPRKAEAEAYLAGLSAGLKLERKERNL